MFQRKRKSGVYLHNYTRFKTVTKIIFILIISLAIAAADSKCKLTSKGTKNCDPSRLRNDDDGDSDNGFKNQYTEANTKIIPHSSNHHNKLQLTQMKNSIYKYINDMINTRTSEILANSMNQLQLEEQRDFPMDADNDKFSESDMRKNIEKFMDYLDSSDGNTTNGRQLDSSEGRLFFFKGNSVDLSIYTK